MEEKNKIINIIETNNIPKKKRKRKRKRKKKNINQNIINNIEINKEITHEINLKNDTYINNDIETIEISDIKSNDEINLQNEDIIRKKKKLIPLITIFTSLIIIIITTITIIFFNTNIYLIGNKLETIEVLSTYNDPGFKATIFKKDINNKVTISSNVNTNKIGTYTISYKLAKPLNKKIKRTIEVVDTTKPTITLIGSDNITTYTNETYIDKGVVIKDNYDTNLTKNLIIENNVDTSKEGTYTITYTIKDSSNNTSSIERTINVKNANICDSSNPIENYICKNNYNVSVGYYNLNNGNTYYFKPNKIYYGASLIKILDALYLYEKNLINDNLKPHVNKIISYSDNDSHHYLVNYIGKNNLKQYGIEIGGPNTLKGTDNYGQTTVKDQIAYLKKLYEITKDNQNDELKNIFINSSWNLLKFNGSPSIMHKYGHWENAHHNVGIVLDENPYILVILTNEGNGNFYNIMQTISKLMYEYHKKNN